MPSVRVDPKKVRTFEDEASFYAWLGKHWNKEPVRSRVLVRSRPRKRSTSRTKKSLWSQVNVANVERLTKAGKCALPATCEMLKSGKTIHPNGKPR